MKICFLDRDGVIIKDTNYLSKLKDISFKSGIFEGLKKIQNLGYRIYIVTNQSAVARGYLSEKKLKKINNYIAKILLKKGIKIYKISYCPHHPYAKIKKYRKDCFFRKPKPGMVLKIIKKNKRCSKEKSFLIGDQVTDLKAGKKAGLRKNFLLKKGVNFHIFVKNLIFLRKIN